MPLFVTLVLYVFAVGREVLLFTQGRQVSQQDFNDENFPPAFEITSENNTEMIVKVNRGSGKEIKLEESVERLDL
jgi:hypothetical protein